MLFNLKSKVLNMSNKKRAFINNNEDYIPLSSSTLHSTSSSNANHNQRLQTSYEKDHRINKRPKTHSIYGDFKLYPRLNEV